MSDDPTDVRWDVIQNLQSLERRLNPGSAAADDANHAITLALNADRAVINAPFLFRNVLRDAGRIRRRRAGRDHILDRLDETSSIYNAAIEGKFPAVVETATPESILAANELEDLVMRAAARLDKNGRRYAEALVRGDVVEDIASAIGASARTVRRFRERLRQEARELLTMEAA